MATFSGRAVLRWEVKSRVEAAASAPAAAHEENEMNRA
jgi:hypothetical protein